MYENYFNFTAKPFAMNPDPGFLYHSSRHAAALTMLEYAIESQAPFCMLTGDIGSGKTTLLRHLLRCLGGSVTVGLISNTHGDFRSIHPWLLSSLGIVPCEDSDIARYEALIGFFVREYAQGRRTLLVVDEAHNLEPGTLEELRLLSNVNSEKDLAVQVLLVGQPELRIKLKRPELEQFAQRVSVDFHLSPLSLDDSYAYVQHRLSIAGGDPAIFERDAIKFVHAKTGGVPRLMNQLCDLALVYAFAEQRRVVKVKMLKEVLKDRRERGAIPLFGRRTAARHRVPATVSGPSERG